MIVCVERFCGIFRCVVKGRVFLGRCVGLDEEEFVVLVLVVGGEKLGGLVWGLVSEELKLGFELSEVGSGMG